MPSIETLGYPLVYKLAPGVFDSAPESGRGDLGVRVKARALEGMQKEALLLDLGTSSGWRMVSDEGPYLNGTDLAPFPLAFFASGMAFSYLNRVVRLAQAQSIDLKSLSLHQDNYYTMQGSALRGDMIGGGRPVEMAVQVRAEAPNDQLASLLERAAPSCPAHAYMRHELQNTFHLASNGQRLTPARVSPSPAEPQPDPAPDLDSAAPAPGWNEETDIIEKVRSAEALKGVEGGAGSSLQTEQKRTLHVKSEAGLRADGLLVAEVTLLKPIGSTFRFRSDRSGRQAPPPLSYLAAGIGFCYLTQLGRYAQIVKIDLQGYRVVQDNFFQREAGDEPTAVVRPAPVDTHLFLDLEADAEAAERLLWMGERTCFLHASMRDSYPSRISAEVNGEQVDPKEMVQTIGHDVKSHAP